MVDASRQKGVREGRRGYTACFQCVFPAKVGNSHPAPVQTRLRKPTKRADIVRIEPDVGPAPRDSLSKSILHQRMSVIVRLSVY